MAGFDTAKNILNDAAIELGLIAEALADPFASTDNNIRLLRNLAKGAGQDLLRAHPWSHLHIIHTFNTANGTASYSLPADFNRLVDTTQWNRTQQLPVPAGVSPQQWQMLKAMTNSGVVYRLARIFGDLMYLHPTPSATETVAYEYISRYWVKPTGQSSPTTEWPDSPAGTDTWHFDRRLFVAALKLAYRENKGFDSSAELRKYLEAFAAAAGGDGDAPVLSVSRRAGPRPFWNIPETGYGS